MDALTLEDHKISGTYLGQDSILWLRSEGKGILYSSLKKPKFKHWPLSENLKKATFYNRNSSDTTAKYFLSHNKIKWSFLLWINMDIIS